MPPNGTYAYHGAQRRPGEDNFRYINCYNSQNMGLVEIHEIQIIPFMNGAKILIWNIEYLQGCFY